jgi:hypothetical protein
VQNKTLSQEYRRLAAQQIRVEGVSLRGSSRIFICCMEWKLMAISAKIFSLQHVERERNGQNPGSQISPFELTRELQSVKMRELRDALVKTDYRRLDAQALVLGLSRSTTWSILQAKHKRTGLSAAVVKRMLNQPKLPPLVRATILEYVKEKSRGAYGHTRLQQRRFAAAL